MFIFKMWFHTICFIKKIVLKLVFGRRLNIGHKVQWRQRFNIMIYRTGNVEIGDYCFFNNDCTIFAHNKVKIGEGTLFGENVKIYDHNHRFNNFKIPIKEQGFSVGSVVVGKHCWIGSNVVLLKGTKIGDNCVIGAGVVISGTINENTIVSQNVEYNEKNILESVNDEKHLSSDKFL